MTDNTQNQNNLTGDALPELTNDPTQALLRIIHGDTKDLHIPHKSIVTGKRIRNTILRKFIDKYRKLNKLTDKQLIDIILSFDEVVEKELLTEDILEHIRKNPDALSKLKKKK